MANHLGSSSLEVDELGGLISYEEYIPYGETAFQAGKSAAEVLRKRYRYTGKERDSDNGSTYHVARYCAPWLGGGRVATRSGVSDALNLYAYVSANPLTFVDTRGETKGREKVRTARPTTEAARRVVRMNGRRQTHAARAARANRIRVAISESMGDYFTSQHVITAVTLMRETRISHTIDDA